jgi:16S rRNA (cytosine1402-N4)-methyltransferase
MQNKNQNTHQPVLVTDVVRLLNPKYGEAYFDGTAGYGGHAGAIMEHLGPEARVVLVDQDTEAIDALKQSFGSRVELRHQNYAEAARELADAGAQFDLILLDLGVSSPQFDNLDRGFSFRGSARLDMRMNQEQDLDAWEIVNIWKASELEQIIRDYGEERRARAVAAAIVAARPLETTADLAKVVRSVVRQSGDTDAATRTFQALRIAVNGELDRLSEALPLLTQLLATDGRLAIISFHSLEDRIVKTFIETETRDCICPPKQPVCTCDHVATLVKLTKKPVLGRLNDDSNPRARSATLRVAVKLKPKQKEVRV